MVESVSDSPDPMVCISGVSERDIDLLLLEEFLSSPDFLQWFTAHVLGPSFNSGSLLGTWRSVTQSSGESDLEVAFQDQDGRHVRLLIENKVNASLQPRQAERYQERGRSYIENGECVKFCTVLVGPERYFGKGHSLKGFDARVMYEEIRDWFARSQGMGPRKRYKCDLLKAGIEKGTVGYQVVADAPVTEFWRQYWELTLRIAPELEMKEPIGKPARAGFIKFDPVSLPRGVSLVHKLGKGYVDLQFSGMGKRLSELRSKFGDYVEPGMQFKQATKSGAIRVNVPKLHTASAFPPQEDNTRQGLAAAERLLDWFLKYREHWN